MARILISGGSGFIGSPLSVFLIRQGHTLISLIRPQDKEFSSSITWDPLLKKAKGSDFDGFDGVIHLAGEPLSFSRWSSSKKKKIYESRAVGTKFLADLLAEAQNPPKFFISASAVGFYGNRGEEVLTEESSAGNSFLSTVCKAWEEAARALEEKGIRVASLRFGMVLGPNGGALEKMLPIYRLGLGGSLGSGRQWLSWIHLEDLVRAVAHVIEQDSLKGPINFVSNQPIRQGDFAKTLAELIARPHFFKVPACLLKAVLGTMGKDLLLASAHVKCSKLLASNFSFKYSDLRSALVSVV